QIKAVLNANPNSLDALRLMGQITLSQYDFDSTDRVIAAMRKVDRKSMDAHNLMAQQRPQDAEQPIRKVLDRQPKNIEAMGLLAAVNALELKEQKANDVLRQVDAIAPNNATAYFEV